MASTTVLGFVGLGVMGEPMCKNLAAKSGARVVAFDARPGPLDTLAAHGVERAASVTDVAARADIVFVCLPGEPQVRAVCLGADGLIERLDAGRTLVDGLTAPSNATLPAARVGYILPWGSATAAAVEEALKAGMREKSQEFRRDGEIYVKN